MPIGGSNNAITVDVAFRAQVLQSSIAELQKALNSLKPNSDPFNKLQKVINLMTREMENLQVQTSKGFGSQTQFNQTYKTIEKIENELARSKLIIDDIDFNDLQLTDEQVASFDRLNENMKQIQDEFAKAKQVVKEGLIKSGNNEELLKGIDPTYLNDDLDKIESSIEKYINKISGNIQKLITDTQNSTASLVQTQSKQLVAQRFLQGGGLTAKNVKGTDFEQYFRFDDAGQLAGFQTRGFAEGSKKAFVEALKQIFTITPADENKIIREGIKGVNSVLEAMPDSEIQKAIRNWENRVASASKKAEADQIELNTAQGNLSNAQGLQNQIKEATSDTSEYGLRIAQLEQEAQALRQIITEQQQAVVEDSQALREAKGAADSAGEAMVNLKGDVNDANNSFNALSRQKMTFESLKSAVTNFMGFNQVLNMTKRAVSEAANHIKTLDSVMNGIAIVTDMTTADLWKQVDTYSAMAQSYGVSIEGAYQVSQIYYQQGRSNI